MVAALRGEGLRRRRDILRIATRRRLQVVAGDMAMSLLADGDVASTTRARERECVSAGLDHLGPIREACSVKGRREPVGWTPRSSKARKGLPCLHEHLCKPLCDVIASFKKSWHECDTFSIDSACS
jgi:hypothetical protein